MLTSLRGNFKRFWPWYFMALWGMLWLAQKAGVISNHSNSMPIGLYLVTHDTSDLVGFCLEGTPAQTAITRQYILGNGPCDYGGERLVKRLAALPGDTVETSAIGLRVNGTLLSGTVPLRKDSRGRPITPYPFGVYAVQDETVWVYSDYNPHSFDSRYFGPIKTRDIREHLKMLWTFSSPSVSSPLAYALVSLPRIAQALTWPTSFWHEWQTPSRDLRPWGW